jgi:hypothetical protein
MVNLSKDVIEQINPRSIIILNYKQYHKNGRK